MAANAIRQGEESRAEGADPLRGLKVKLFADGADKAGMLEMYRLPHIQGFTTNPTLMRKAGIKDYEAFARDILAAIPDRPISLEVFADEFSQMERQARLIAGWGQNVYVKIPVSNTKGESAAPLVERLKGRNTAQCHGPADFESGSGCLRCPPRRRAGLCIGFCGAYRRHGPGPDSRHGCRRRDAARRSWGGTDLGQPTRTAERDAGGCHRLPHHHRDLRHS